MKPSSITQPDAPSVRAYLLAALLFPPRGVRMGWGMKHQPFIVRLLLSVLPLVGPAFGVVMLVRALV